MSINIPPHRRRDALLRMPLSDLAGWHLLASCDACRQDRIVSILSLAERYGGEITLLPLLARLRCGLPKCRLPPAALRLRNRLPVQPGGPLVDVPLIERPDKSPRWR